MKKLFYILFFFALANTAFSGWTIVNTGTTNDFTSVNVLTSQLYFATAVNNSTWAGVLFKTTNGGTNWTQLQFPSGFNYPQALDMSENGMNGIVAGSSILMTSNGGLNWVSLYTPSDTVVFFGVNVVGDSPPALWAVGNKASGQTITGTVIVRCSNIMSGNAAMVRMSLPPSMSSYQLTSVRAIDSTTCFIGVNGHPVFDGILKTTNKGVNWTQTSTNMEIWSVSVSRDDGRGYAVGGYNALCGIFRTTNNGMNWESVFSLNHSALKGLFRGAYVYAVGNEGIIIKGNYFGDMWWQQNSGVTTDLNAVEAVDENSDVAVAVGDNGLILKTTDGGIGIQNISSEVPSSFTLHQNYPNPFNPVTNIKFDIQKSSDVKIIISDVMGREITTLVNEQLKPGTYNVDWDAINYPSGVYFYRLTAGDFAETKKMILIK